MTPWVLYVGAWALLALFAAVALGGMCYLTGHAKFSSYLNIPFIQGAGELFKRLLLTEMTFSDQDLQKVSLDQFFQILVRY